MRAVAKKERDPNWARSCFSSQGRHGFNQSALLIDAVSSVGAIPVADCPEELAWIAVCIRNILNALGVSKKTEPQKVVNKVAPEIGLMEDLARRRDPIRPVLRLVERGVKTLEFFVRDSGLFVRIVWDKTRSLTLYGPTQHFFA